MNCAFGNFERKIGVKGEKKSFSFFIVIADGVTKVDREKK